MITITCHSPRDGVLCFSSLDSDHTAVIARRDDQRPQRPACYELSRSDGRSGGIVCAGELPFWWVARRAVEWVIAGGKEAP